jgi:hypothetical protein
MAGGMNSVIAAIPDEEMVVVSGVASPRVAYGLSHERGTLTVRISVASFETPANEGGIGVQLGLAADKAVTLSEKEAMVTKTAQAVVYQFRVPEGKLVAVKEDWDKLRMGITVSWPGGPFGQPRQRESFLQSKTKVPHASLSALPEDWQLVSLAEYERSMADRRTQIAFDFNQPVEGKASIVIEDEKGNRVRNLISGRELAKGKQRIVWDATNEKGDVMPPGKYQWRAISHPGLKPHYDFSFCDAPGSPHLTFHAAASNSRYVFLGTSISEGGYEIIQLEPDGKLVRGCNATSPSTGRGVSRVAIAADEQFLYAAYDGRVLYADRTKPDWSTENKISLFRFDLGAPDTLDGRGLATGKFVDYSPTNRAAILRTYMVGPGSPDKSPDGFVMAGLALFKGRLYLGDQAKSEVLEIDPATGVVARTFALPNPVALAGGANGLYAISGHTLVEIDPVAGQIRREIATLAGIPAGLTVDKDGKFYVSDAQLHVVNIFDDKGKLVGKVGKDGGITQGSTEVVPNPMGGLGETTPVAKVTAGPYDPLRLHQPAGLTVGPDGHLWVTEFNRFQPKRFAAYDPKAGTMWKEFFGPAAYGAPGGGFDPEDSTRWIGQGTLFKLDFAAKTAKPISILGGEEGRAYRFWRQDGRTFVIACGRGATYIQELLPANSLKPLAFITSAHLYAREHNWKPPAEFVEAFNAAYPDPKNHAPATKYESGTFARPKHGFGMMWVDKNGDGKVQKEEIDFPTAAESFAGANWGHDFQDLTLRVPATVGGKSVLVALRPQGWWPGGAPKYPSLNEAVKAATPIDFPPFIFSVESTVDRFNTIVFNSDPMMKAFSPEGKLLWTYPNRWRGVQGSQSAPLPTAGELQGVLFFSGVAPLDDKSDVMVMNGNHGRAFVMTTDGLYIDEMFPDVRLMTASRTEGIGILGGECFGGSFGKSKTDGNYYFQGGGFVYRIYRVDGLRETIRSGGTFTVTPEQVVAAERNRSRMAAAEAKLLSTMMPYVKTPPKMDGKTGGWTGEPTAQWNKGNQFPVTIRAAHDGKKLYLSYTVKDASPWVNNGRDWQTLFKTGDSVDLQIGSDSKANPKRGGPVPGDLRLLIAPFQEGNIAVLYRHRQPGATDSAIFQSPWRGEKVDSVRKLESAQIVVTKSGDSYNVEVAVPLDELGLSSSLGKTLRGDFGIIYGDAEGTANIFRNYWSNQATGLINDVPGEIMLSPNLWGDINMEALP